MKTVVLAAGKGTRFNTTKPKPLIEFNGKTMLDWVIFDLKVDPKDVIIVTQECFNLNDSAHKVIELNKYTDGPACTAAEALLLIDPNEELIVVNCDQRMLDFDSNSMSDYARINNLDAVIGVFPSSKPHNSYVCVDQDNLIAYVKEKRVISNLATNGVHYWKKASLFHDSYTEMVQMEDRVNGEFYISQTFNYLINRGYRVGPYYFNMHFPIGVPEDLNSFIRMGI